MQKKSKDKKVVKGYDGHNECKYRENFPELLREHMASGFTFGTFGAIAKVSREALYLWCKKYPAFLEAKEIGELQAEKFFEQQAIDQVTGTSGGNASTLKLIMSNRFKYTDKTEISADESAKSLLAQAPLINVVFTSPDKDGEK